MTSPTHHPTSSVGHRRGRAATRTARVVAAAAVATTAAFAAGCLLTQTVIVPQWRALDPVTFLQRFQVAGPATGATLFPIEIAAVGLLTLAAVRARRGRDRAGRWWTLALVCMIGTVALLPAHFAAANRALLDPAFPVADVADQLAAWNRWNWARTALAILATAAGVTALASAPAPPRSGLRDQ